MRFFPFPLWIENEKLFTACTGSLLISLKSRFQLMNNKIIKHDLENLPCCMGDLCYQLNQLGTCFAFLIHLTGTFLRSISSMDSPDWINNFFSSSVYVMDHATLTVKDYLIDDLAKYLILPIRLLVRWHKKKKHISVAGNSSHHISWH